jgi:drug/metabolite transporter (DMT)-like permease
LHRELTVAVLFVVLGAGVLHAVWNAITKAVDDRLMAFAWIGVSVSVLGGFGLALTGMPPLDAVWFAVASAVVHVVYDFALMRAYRLGAFNQVYPIARGTSPLVVAVGAAVFASERLGWLPLTGIVVLAAGLMSLAFSSGHVGRSEVPAVGAALATGLTIATYSLIDGLGVRHAPDPFSYMGLQFLLEGPFFVVLAARRPWAEWTKDRVMSRGLLAGVLMVAAYGAVMWAQTRAPLAEVAALRETGVISAAVIGAVFFRERFGLRRIGAAAVVALGIVLIGL